MTGSTGAGGLGGETEPWTPWRGGGTGTGTPSERPGNPGLAVTFQGLASTGIGAGFAQGNWAAKPPAAEHRGIWGGPSDRTGTVR